MERKKFARLACLVVLIILNANPLPAAEATSVCIPMGWSPTAFGLKDHSVFLFDGYYYLVSIYRDSQAIENRFAYARSRDLCAWEELPSVLSERLPGSWDESQIWAPFVYLEEGIYYLYYTGVTADMTQSIMLANSTNPADPAAWTPQGMIFQPNHPGTGWTAGAWADNRDPTMLKIGNLYYLYYAASDLTGGIVGLATAYAPQGPWTDWGGIIVTPNGIPESPTVTTHDGLYYLFYNDTGLRGERYRIGPSPAGPWTEAQPFSPGWAHEFWVGYDGQEYTSYLTDSDAITISRLKWNANFSFPRPFIDEGLRSLFLPLVLVGG